MARGTNMAAWFKKNRKAQTAVARFIKKRTEGDRTSVLSFLGTLQAQHDFPFTSEPSLVRYLKAAGMGERIDPAPKPVSFEPTASRGHMRAIHKAKRWVITAAQNDTEVDGEFLRALENYCEYRGAQLVVRKLRYNKASWWDPRVHQYLVDDEINLKDVVIPDVRITATVANPLSGLDARSGAKHGVYASTKLAMKTVATPQNKLPKILYATGAITEPNYRENKTGNLAEFHHSKSAVVIEEDPKTGVTLMRALSWDGQKFYDIDIYATSSGVYEAGPWAALIPGDEHAWFVDPLVKAATYTSADSMKAIGRPEYLLRHDLLDCYSVSHHHRGSTLKVRNKAVLGWGSLEKELSDTVDFLNETGQGMVNVMVNSNHSDHLSKWIDAGEKYVSPENMLLYLELKAAMIHTAEATDTGFSMVDPFQVYCEGQTEPEIQWLDPVEPFMVSGIDLSQHGHLGPNGSRGSAMSLSRMGVKTVIGHSHSPCIVGGCTQVGTSTRYDLEYCQGPSSWLHCHCILYENGKRQLVPIIKGQWRVN